jgi:hypothetical protein
LGEEFSVFAGILKVATPFPSSVTAEGEVEPPPDSVTVPPGVCPDPVTVIVTSTGEPESTGCVAGGAVVTVTVGVNTGI